MPYHTFKDLDTDDEAELGNEYGSFEVFFVSELEAQYNRENSDHGNDFTLYESGWYWWSCFPGCLPDGPALGPFETEQAAIDDAQCDY